MTREELQADGPSAGEGAQSMCRLPLVSRDRVLGVLSVGAVREHAFTDDDVSFLGDVAKQVAIAVENAIAYDKIATLTDNSRRRRYISRTKFAPSSTSRRSSAAATRCATCCARSRPSHPRTRRC
jgi:GAF domain-containing protein